MSLAHCTRDMSTRPPSVVARSVIRNELIPVLEWFINGRPGQLTHVRRYADKVQGRLAKDGIAFPTCSRWFAGTGTAEELLAECRRLHEDLREAEQLWLHGSEEAVARARLRGEQAKVNLENARRVRREGTQETSVAPDSCQATPDASDASEALKTPADENPGEAA